MFPWVSVGQNMVKVTWQVWDALNMIISDPATAKVIDEKWYREFWSSMVLAQEVDQKTSVDRWKADARAGCSTSAGPPFSEETPDR